MSRPTRPSRPDPAGFAYDRPREDTRTSASGFLLSAVRSRPIGRALLSTLTVVLFVSGAGMFAYPFFTDVYTENVIQDRLSDEFDSAFQPGQPASYEDWEASVKGETGKALTRISIPKLGVDTMVVEGTSPAALRAGAGHYPNTPLPGQTGNVAIAGHRTTYGRPFNRIDELAPGDEIWLSTPVGDYRYVVSPAPQGWNTNPYVTGPRDWTVIDQTPEAVLTLTTCHPKGSAAQRLIVRATLAGSEAPGSYAQRAA